MLMEGFRFLCHYVRIGRGAAVILGSEGNFRGTPGCKGTVGGFPLALNPFRFFTVASF